MTRETIVLAAEALLIQNGYAGFTVRRVAQKVGISRGNLNYYFPTKASLVETLITYTLAQYRHRVRTAGRQLNTGTLEALGDVLLWLMRDARSDHTNRLFRELWAISMHDSRVAKAMDAFYSRSVNAHLRRLRDTPDRVRGCKDVEATIYLMHVISEGVSVIFGTRSNADPLFRRVQDAAHRAVMHLLMLEGDGDGAPPRTKG